MTDRGIPIGELVRIYRKNRTQVVIAGLAGISERYLSLIEQGRKTPSITTLHRIARALGVPVSVLLAAPVIDEPGAVHPIAARMQAALMGYAPEPPEPAQLAALRARVEAAWAIWQGAPHRFTELAAVLPELTVEVQHARTHTGTDGRESAVLAADLYFLLRSFTKRIGRPDLSLLVADRALLAAQEADDPLRVAGARWNLAQILNSDGEYEGAREVARIGIDTVTRELPDSVDAKAIEGALWLITAVATQRCDNAWAAREILRTHAAEAAAVTGETNTCWTVFGPTNVALHRLSVEAAAGEATEALRIADTIDVSASPSLERRTTFYLEAASCYDQKREDSGVLVHLQAAEGTGPEDLRYNTLARELVRALLKRSRPSMRPQVAGLAARVGLVGEAAP